MSCIFDASALLALIRVERGADVVRAHIEGAQMSTVNLSEVVARLTRDHQPDFIARALEQLALVYRAPDEWLAIDAGLIAPITSLAGLSLGDRLCLALGRRLNLPIVTADRDWDKVAPALNVRLVQIRD
jgi:PIN domain nuclease of toxin-antitoxin system